MHWKEGNQRRTSEVRGMIKVKSQVNFSWSVIESRWTFDCPWKSRRGIFLPPRSSMEVIICRGGENPERL